MRQVNDDAVGKARGRRCRRAIPSRWAAGWFTDSVISSASKTSTQSGAAADKRFGLRVV